MNPVSQTLLEQMHITEEELQARKAAFRFDADDAAILASLRSRVEPRVNDLVEQFHAEQTALPEVAHRIGDADTLRRLKDAQRRYVAELFCGNYGLDYLNNRLRIGLVHKRIGVEPRLYLAAMYRLREMVVDMVGDIVRDPAWHQRAADALERLCMFDTAVVFEAFVRSLVSDLETSHDRLRQYAGELEKRSRELEALSRTDPLTGLLNRRYLMETFTHLLRRAERRAEMVTLVYMDVDDFKRINDSRGHLHGDAVLRTLADVLRTISRLEDATFRFGGDEFCVLLPDCSEDQARKVYISRLEEELQRTLPGVSLSIGCVQTGPETYHGAEDLIRLADEHMYRQKGIQPAGNTA